MRDSLPYKDASYPGDDFQTSGSSVQSDDRNLSRFYDLEHPVFGGLAQSVSASGLHPEGSEFESRVSHHPYKEIVLTRGYIALVSPEDYDRVACHKWTAMPIKGKDLVYARRSVWGDDGKCHTILLHRFIARTPKGVLTDHRDGNGLDCRRHNLRSATHAQNSYNKRCKLPLSGLIGVSSQTPGRYRAVVARDGKRIYTTTYPSPGLAAAARDALARELHGEFCVLNFPEVAA